MILQRSLREVERLPPPLVLGLRRHDVSDDLELGPPGGAIVHEAPEARKPADLGLEVPDTRHHTLAGSALDGGEVLYILKSGLEVEAAAFDLRQGCRKSPVGNEPRPPPALDEIEELLVSEVGVNRVSSSGNGSHRSTSPSIDLDRMF